MLTRMVLAGLFLLGGLLPAAGAAEAGRVVFVTGTVQGGGQPVRLDGVVSEGDELSTGADGYVYIKTVDAGFLILRPNSRARIVTYHVDQVEPSNTHVKLELLSGVARSISGLSVKQARQNFRFNTPVAAIGVRGTDFIVYTDQQTSRVSVLSGGVVVSAFSGNCGPDGTGPCEGKFSRELFAGKRGTLLQVERGDRMPQLLQNPALSPDQNANPRSDEPGVKLSLGAGGGVALPALNLDAKKSVDLVTIAVPGSGATVPPEVLPQPVVTPPDPKPPVVPPVAKGTPEVFWGRWQAAAGQHVDAAAMDKVGVKSADGQTFVGDYVIARSKSPTLVMPRDGQASFVMTSGEAVMRKKGQAEMVAAIVNPHLDVNFGTRTFTTGLTVVAGGTSVQVNAAGDVTSLGALVGAPLSSTQVRGYLGGANAEEAGYIFLNAASPTVTVQGATKWGR